MIDHHLADHVKLLVIACTLAALFWAYHRRHRIRTQGDLDAVFVTLGLLAAASYVNLGSFHGAYGYVHTWEMFHYYLPSKYASELGYDGLYAAALVADAESDAPYFESVTAVRDMRSYALLPAERVLEDPSIRARFSPERWAEFRDDVDYLKHRYERVVWPRIFRDHGYNAPPSRTLLAGLLANALGPASDRSLYAIALLDPVLLAVLLVAIYRLYGLRNAALVTILFGVNALSKFYWVGGAFVRVDWLALTGLGICALSAKRHGLAGALLGAATAMRIFPALFALGVVLRGVFALASSRRWQPCYTRFLIGSVSTGAGLVLLSLAAGGGLEAWLDFHDKITFHVARPSFNSLGLSRLSAHAAFLWPAQLAAVGAYLVALTRLEDDAQAAILGGVLVFVFGQLAGYYYAFLIFFLLWQRRPQPDLFGCFFQSALLCVPVLMLLFQRERSWGHVVSFARQPEIYFQTSLVLLLVVVLVFAGIFRKGGLLPSAQSFARKRT